MRPPRPKPRPGAKRNEDRRHQPRRRARAAPIELPDDIFGIDEIRADILQRCVTWQLAKRRAGTHKVQVRNEVSRTGKKMYRQKGTGGARHGSRRARAVRRRRPGARTGGAQPRDRPAQEGPRAGPAARAVLEGQGRRAAWCWTSATLDAPKTAALRAGFAKIGVTNALVIAGPEVDGAFKLAARNIPGVDVLPNAGLNVYDVLRRDTLVLTKAAVEGIAARFAPERREGGRLMPAARHYDTILSPVITEKATMLSEQNKVVFRVAKDATKAADRRGDREPVQGQRGQGQHRST